MSGVLHEMEDVAKVFDKLKGIGNDAIVHLNVPNRDSFHRMLGVRMGLIQNCASRSDFNIRYQIQKIYSMDDLKSLAQENKFKVLDSGYYGFKPFTHMQMRELFRNKFFGPEVVEQLYSASDLFGQYSAELYVELMKE
jgi:hypothetical protein